MASMPDLARMCEDIRMGHDLFFDPAAFKPHVNTRIAIMVSGKKSFDITLIPI
jgi:hypothetical protein